MSEIITPLVFEGGRTLSELCSLLEMPSSVLILTHTNPDADTLGSAFALREILRVLDKKCEVINDDDIPKRLKFIFGEDSLSAEQLPEGFEPELYITVDVSTSKLLGSFEALYAEKIGLAIDHHVRGTPFAKDTFIAGVGACAEIIFEIACEFARRGKNVLNRAAAVAIYAAICSDTGSFKFESVTSDTHRRIAALLDYGINHSEIARRLYDSRPISQVMATKVALNVLHFYNNNRVAVINFTNQMLIDNNLTREDIDDIISLTRSIEGVEIGMTIKQSENDPNEFRVSMRSNRVTDVSKLCALFGGGGHKRASGCTLKAADEKEAEAALISVIEAELASLDSEGAFENSGEL
jgi:phosphoesterase RecJ-like protein